MSTKDFLEKDYYKTLGVPKDASPDAIKKAYRKLARQYHPDAHSDATERARAEEKFKEISEAYDVLADPKRRAEYDEARALFGAGGFRARGGPGGAGGQGGATFDLGDMFGGSGLGDVLGDIFGNRGGRTTRHGPRRGADVESEVRVSFSDAIHGVTMPLRVASEAACDKCRGTGSRSGAMPTPCGACGGSGQTSRNLGGFGFAEPCRECRGRGLVVEDPCLSCGGSGRAMSSRSLNVRIPAGVRDGQRIRLKGKGAPGERGGLAGDLLVVVHVDQHRIFGRSGDNLTLTVPVTFPEAALGGQITVPTLDGSPVTLKVPAGTASGRTFRVRGKGVRRKDGSHGDLLVKVEVAVPGKLNGKAKQALEDYQAATAGEDPRAGLTQAAKEG